MSHHTSEIMQKLLNICASNIWSHDHGCFLRNMPGWHPGCWNDNRFTLMALPFLLNEMRYLVLPITSEICQGVCAPSLILCQGAQSRSAKIHRWCRQMTRLPISGEARLRHCWGLTPR